MKPIASARPNNINVYCYGKRWVYYKISVKDMTKRDVEVIDMKKEIVLIPLITVLVLVRKEGKLAEFLKNLEKQI